MVEVLLIAERSHNCWLALVKPGRKLKIGSQIIFHPKKTSQITELTAIVIEHDAATGGRVLQFNLPENLPLMQVLDDFGEIPLPPYITASESTPDQYQTVYAQIPGAVAAPTAGLHFTQELLTKLTDRGVELAEVTLHVGIGTFRPVETENITSIKCIKNGCKFPNLPSTKLSLLKHGEIRYLRWERQPCDRWKLPPKLAKLKPYSGDTDIFIYPGYQWQIVDGLITNFHLPGSSLMMLVSALIGRERLLSLYQTAIDSNYRFYSFGDAMLILPQVINDK